MGEESKRTYTIRIPAAAADHLEQAARDRGITPTTLIQSLVVQRLKSNSAADREIAADATVAAKLQSLRTSIAHLEQSSQQRFDELRFEVVKTRSALLHSLDQTLGSAAVDQIIEASEQTAHEYSAGLARAAESEP